ncbi:DUF551 domain-containing protein [Acinetobacter pittii]|nr:DUF551 domain-containing protein [Acinetobacter pittii]PPC02482.1 hypothetical protein ApiMCR53_05755 [Acinetobacter pittii]WPP78253.1 DUF551 domain-containing protein [Acinetobacter pittii]
MDMNKEREAFEQHLIDTGLVEFAGYGFDVDECDEYTHEPTNVAWGTWVIGLNRAKTQAVPTWISVKDEEPPSDTTVLICWSDSQGVQPEIDYMTCDEDLNHIWANFEKDPPTHWMYFHKLPSEL